MCCEVSGVTLGRDRVPFLNPLMSTALVKRPFGHIYLVRNTLNGKIYVGQTTSSVENRWRRHCWEVRRKRGHFPCALLKHGVEFFHVIPEFSAENREELNVLEILYIALRGSADPDVGYNLALGGSAGKPSDASLERMRAASRRRFGDGWAGTSEETRKKMSEGQKRRYLTHTHPMLGKKMPPEIVERISAKNRGRKNPKNAVLMKARQASTPLEKKRAAGLKGASSRWGKTYQ